MLGTVNELRRLAGAPSRILTAMDRDDGQCWRSLVPPLDGTAVAGIGIANPLPPLPVEFLSNVMGALPSRNNPMVSSV